MSNYRVVQKKLRINSVRYAHPLRWCFFLVLQWRRQYSCLSCPEGFSSIRRWSRFSALLCRLFSVLDKRFVPTSPRCNNRLDLSLGCWLATGWAQEVEAFFALWAYPTSDERYGYGYINTFGIIIPMTSLIISAFLWRHRYMWCRFDVIWRHDVRFRWNFHQLFRSSIWRFTSYFRSIRSKSKWILLNFQWISARLIIGS